MIGGRSHPSPIAIGWFVAALLALALATSLVSGLSTDNTEGAFGPSLPVPAALDTSLSTEWDDSLTSVQSDSQLQPLALTTQQKAALIGINNGLLGVGNFVAFTPMVAKDSTSY